MKTFKDVVHLVIKDPAQFEVELYQVLNSMAAKGWETELHYQVTSHKDIVYSCLIIAKGE